MKINSGNTGLLGEEIISNYLEDKGFLIIERNFKEEKVGEIDIIAAKDGVLHFVEVKSSAFTGIYDENHTVKHFDSLKKERIIRTMERYCFYHNVSHKTRCVDLAAVSIIPATKKIKIYYEENVYMSTI